MDKSIILLSSLALLQIASSIMMIVSIWYSSDCTVDIRYLGVITPLIPLLPLPLMACKLERFYDIVKVLQNMYVIGYICMFVLHTINTVFTPSCMMMTARVFLWISLGIAMINGSFFFYLQYVQTIYKDWRWSIEEKNQKIKLEKFAKVLELLYDPRETFSNLEKKNQLTQVMSEFASFLESEPLSEGEVDLIFKYFGTKITGKEDEKMDCHSCGRDMEIDEQFTQIPDCSHRVCKTCMKGWTSKEFK